MTLTSFWYQSKGRSGRFTIHQFNERALRGTGVVPMSISWLGCCLLAKTGLYTPVFRLLILGEQTSYVSELQSC